MINATVEKRQFPRVNAKLPLRIADGLLGETLDLSESGIRFVIDRALLPTETHARIEVSPEDSIDTEFKVAWDRPLAEEDKFAYGVSFLGLREIESAILREAILTIYESYILDRAKDDESKKEISIFFRKKFKKYFTEIVKLNRRIDHDEVSKEEAEREFFSLTDEILQGAEYLEKIIPQRIVIKKIKESFRKLVGYWIYKGLIVKRAFEKPRGYPGDYETLERIYSNQSLSEGIGCFSDKYFLHNEYAVAVRNRKDTMKKMLTEHIQNPNFPSVKILNFACGSCREIKELFIDEKFISNKDIFFTLVDQDEEALEYSRKLLKGLPSNIKFNFLEENMLGLLRNKEKADLLKNQTFVYSIGLADYLPERVLKNFMQLCIECLATNGTFIIAHKDINICHPVSPDWFCDWSFYSRTEKDLIDLAKSVTSISNKYEIKSDIREKSQRIFFLTIGSVS